MGTGGLIAIILIALSVHAGSAVASESPRLLEEKIVTIPAGQDSTSVDAASGEESSEGLAAVSEDGTIFYYDTGHDNVKVVENGRVRVSPAIPHDQHAAYPADFVASGDCMYLLADMSGTQPRFRIYRKCGDDPWSQESLFDDPGLGTRFTFGKRHPVYGIVRLYVGPDSTVYLFDGDQGISHPVSAGATMLLPEEQLRRAFCGCLWRDRVIRPSLFLSLRSLLATTSQDTADVWVSICGADARGLLYGMRVSPRERDRTVEVYDKGVLVASRRLGRLNIAKGLAGAGSHIVGASGGLYGFHMTDRGLTVVRWTLVQ